MKTPTTINTQVNCNILLFVLDSVYCDWLKHSQPPTHKHTLCLFVQVTRQEGPLRDIALRQLGIKDTNSNSWFMYVYKIDDTYGINLTLALQFPWKKEAWPRYISDNIGNHWFSSLTEQVLNYSTLSMLVLMGVRPNTPHSLWQLPGQSCYSQCQTSNGQC